MGPTRILSDGSYKNIEWRVLQEYWVTDPTRILSGGYYKLHGVTYSTVIAARVHSSAVEIRARVLPWYRLHGQMGCVRGRECGSSVASQSSVVASLETPVWLVVGNVSEQHIASIFRVLHLCFPRFPQGNYVDQLTNTSNTSFQMLPNSLCATLHTRSIHIESQKGPHKGLISARRKQELVMCKTQLQPVAHASGIICLYGYSKGGLW
jgi:hypothetical protein